MSDRCKAEDWQRDGRGLWAMRACQLTPGHHGHEFGPWCYNVPEPPAAPERREGPGEVVEHTADCNITAAECSCGAATRWALAAPPPAPAGEREWCEAAARAEAAAGDPDITVGVPAPAGETATGKCPRCGSAAIRWNAPYVMCSSCNCATVQRLETWLAVLRDKEQSDGDDAHALSDAIDALRCAQPASSEATLRALADEAASEWEHGWYNSSDDPREGEALRAIILAALQRAREVR